MNQLSTTLGRILCILLLVATAVLSCFGWIAFSDAFVREATNVVEELNDFYEENLEDALQSMEEAILEESGLTEDELEAMVDEILAAEAGLTEEDIAAFIEEMDAEAGDYSAEEIAAAMVDFDQEIQSYDDLKAEYEAIQDQFEDILDEVNVLTAFVAEGTISPLQVSQMCQSALNIVEIVDEMDYAELGLDLHDRSTEEGELYYTITTMATTVDTIAKVIMGAIFLSCLIGIVSILCNNRFFAIFPLLTMTACVAVTYLLCYFGNEVLNEALEEAIDITDILAVNGTLYASWICALLAFILWLIFQPKIMVLKRAKLAELATPEGYAPVYAAPAPVETRCSCGASLPADRLFCSACGRKREARCPNCNATLDGNSPFCTSCGAPIR